MNREIRKFEETTIAEAKERYEVYLRDEKQNKERSYTATLWRLGIFFPDEELCLSALTPSKCASYYTALRTRTTKYGKPLATDSHRNILAEAKTFLKWSVGKGYHDRNWPRKWVAKICKAAGVPLVTAHGMRGLHGTLAVETGISAHAVAAALGHESVTTTLQSYAKAGAGSSVRQQKVLTVLAGGKQDQEHAA